jgi:hypothetical protein
MDPSIVVGIDQQDIGLRVAGQSATAMAALEFPYRQDHRLEYSILAAIPARHPTEKTRKVGPRRTKPPIVRALMSSDPNDQVDARPKYRRADRSGAFRRSFWAGACRTAVGEPAINVYAGSRLTLKPLEGTLPL